MVSRLIAASSAVQWFTIYLLSSLLYLQLFDYSVTDNADVAAGLLCLCTRIEF